VNPSAVGKDKDILNQLADDLAEWSEEDFILPMRDEKYGGYGSLELLLNGLFPVTAKMSLHPLDQDGKRLKKRSGLQAWDGLYDWDAAESVRMMVSVDVPYFVPNRSKITFRVTKYNGWFANSTLQQAKPISFIDVDGKKSVTISEISEFQASSVIDKELQPGNYTAKEPGRVTIIRDINKSSLGSADLNVVDLDICVWLRLSLDGDSEYFERGSIWFPYRKQSSFSRGIDEDPVTWIMTS